MELEHRIVENLSWLKHQARRYYGNPYDAEDLVSDTIEKILTNRSHFDRFKDFKPWAMAIMRNIFITQYNRKLCVPFVGIDGVHSYSSPIAADHRESINRIFSAIRRCARESIAIECVVLYAKGYTYKEISGILGIPIGTVMSRISNGRKMLRDVLE